MGGSKKTARKEKRPGRKARRLVGLLILLVLLWAVVQGSIVRVSCVELPLRDLPAALDGVKILYVSDIHLSTVNPLSKVKRLFDRLQKLEPDLLLLGGDYTGTDIAGMVMSAGEEGAYEARLTDMRDLFFLNLQDFYAPMGKFAVAGDMDNLLERSAGTTLDDAAALGGVTVLRDRSVQALRDGWALTIVGVDDWRTGMQNTAAAAVNVRAGDCAIVLSHNPEALPQLNNQPASGGGLWIDAALSGHTVGGQIRIAGYEVLSPLAGNERYSVGWHMENTAKLLVSEGLSGTALPLRLGSWAQVHLITLRRQKGE